MFALAYSKTLCQRISYQQHLAVIKQLLQAGAPVNLPSPLTPPLIVAVRHRDIGAVQLLLAYGAKVEARDKRGKTALDYAKEQGDPELMRLLSKRG